MLFTQKCKNNSNLSLREDLFVYLLFVFVKFISVLCGLLQKVNFYTPSYLKLNF